MPASSFVSSHSPDNSIHLHHLFYHLLPDLFQSSSYFFPGWSSVHGDSADGRRVICDFIFLNTSRWCILQLHWGNPCNTCYMCQHPCCLFVLFWQETSRMFQLYLNSVFPWPYSIFYSHYNWKERPKGHSSTLYDKFGKWH